VSNSAAERPVATLDIIGFSPHATGPPSKSCDDTSSRPALGSNLIQVVPVPKTGLRGDYDFVKRFSKAGHGNDRVWTRLLAYFKAQEHERPSPKPLDLKGVVMEVLGPKCNERSGTLISFWIVGG
jgi:hypothetical protein